MELVWIRRAHFKEIPPHSPSLPHVSLCREVLQRVSLGWFNLHRPHWLIGPLPSPNDWADQGDIQCRMSSAGWEHQRIIKPNMDGGAELCGWWWCWASCQGQVWGRVPPWDGSVGHPPPRLRVVLKHSHRSRFPVLLLPACWPEGSPTPEQLSPWTCLCSQVKHQS